MFVRATYKALSITLLLFLILIISLFNIYLKNPKEEGFSVAYYIEEEEEIEKSVEEPEDVEVLETHRAYNEAQKEISRLEQNQEAAQNEFEKQMQAMDQAIKNATKQEKISEKEPAKETIHNNEEVIHNENVERNSSVSYFLQDRYALYLPNPVYTCPNQGTIVVHITVDNLGKVIHTNVDNLQSTTKDKCLKEQALEYAKQAKFDTSESSNTTQQGTITYRFIGS